MNFFANPYVILADVMVSLSFILALFLLVRTVDFELIQRIAQRNERRRVMALQFQRELQRGGVLPANFKRVQQTGNKYVLSVGDSPILEVQDDGIFAQRFRLPSGTLDFTPNSSEFASPQSATRALDGVARVLVANRNQIKSLMIEGYANPNENAAWALSQARAERIRAIWARDGFVSDVVANYNTPVFQWMRKNGLWSKKPFNQWHLQEYLAARRRSIGHADGVLPLAWIVTSGRGDGVQKAWPPEKHGATVEFKIEYVERSAPPLDKFLRDQPPAIRQAAIKDGILSSLP